MSVAAQVQTSKSPHGCLSPDVAEKASKALAAMALLAGIGPTDATPTEPPAVQQLMATTFWQVCLMFFAITLLVLTFSRLFKFCRSGIKTLLVASLSLFTSAAALDLGMSRRKLDQAWSGLLATGWAHALLSMFIATGVWATCGYFARERYLFYRVQLL